MSDKKKRGLGRGLGALIPTGPDARTDVEHGGERLRSRGDRHEPTVGPDVAVPRSPDPGVDEAARPGSTGAVVAADVTGTAAGDGDGALGAVPARFAEIPVNAIRPNPRQPRQVFDEEALAELVHSVREIGLLQPVVVRRVDDGYELVAGERRWRAVMAAGLEDIPAIVRDTPDDALLRDALLENLHRADLNPLEEAAAYQQLLDDFGGTQEELATRLGRSRPQVTNTLRLLRLPPAVARRVAAGVLSAGHARALLSLDDPDAMERLATRIVAEGLSVRATEEAVAIGEGDGRARPRTSRPRTGRATDPSMREIADRLGERLETRVRIESGRDRGRIVIDYATGEDLARIVSLMVDGLAG